MTSPALSSRRVRIALDLWVLALSVVLVWPLVTSSGYPLAKDLVFTPRQPMRVEWLGLGDAPARAVPLDAVVSLADALVGGAVLSRIAVLGLLVLAGAAAHRVLGLAHPLARMAAAGFAVWNPFVVERLALGQWALLWAYAATFALAGAAAHYRLSAGGWRPIAPVIAALALAAITPTGALLGAAVALAIGLDRRRHKAVPLLLVCVGMQLPWVLPTLLGDAGLLSDPRGVAAFAARAERPGGAVWSLLGLGGIWDASSAPSSRVGAFGHASSVLVVLGLALGWPGLGRLLGQSTRLRLAVLGGLSFVAAALTTSSAGQAVGRLLVESVPGAGLIRDGQKLLMPFVLLAVLALGATTDRLLRFASVRAAALVPTLAVALIAVPIVALPDATTSTWRTVRPISYPADLEAIAGIVDGTPEALVSLPWEPYRIYRWGRPVPVFDPASRWLDVDVMVSDRLRIGTVTLEGESARAAAVGGALASGHLTGRRLADMGVRWILIQRDRVGSGPGPGDVEGVVTRFAGPEFVLMETPGPWSRSPAPPPWTTALVAAVDILLLLVSAAAVGTVVTDRITSRLNRFRGLPAGMLPRTQRGS
ncbi:MAG TPA: hypothetical protein VIR15_04470 [Intrasporangium sp.]|uniref:hypothetical protein n=1 Tax=Intrasporangium sp. TaxID=1925024 RepID=UPI002F939087